MSDQIPRNPHPVKPPANLPPPRKESLQAENARLKAEVERLTAEVSYDKRVQLHIDKLAAEFTQYEVEKLKAEVERLTDCKAEADRLKAEVDRLRASSFVTAVPVEQYERVIEAGDSIISILCQHVPDSNLRNLALREWLAAKEGKQS